MITTLRKEEWRPVKGYEGIYDVSSFGRIRSIGHGKSVQLKPWKNNNGYLVVTLCKWGMQKDYLVHRLVATAFVPNPNNYPQVNHINELKLDNNSYNLEWCTQSMNNNYWSRSRRAAEKNCKPVEASADKDFKTIEMKFKSMTDAKELGYRKAGISAACNGRSKSYKGFFWRYCQKP